MNQISLGDKKLIIGIGASFHRVDAFFKKEKINYICAADYARLVLDAQAGSPVLRNGTIVSEAYVHFPDGDLLIVRDNRYEGQHLNPLLRWPQQASANHKRGLEFHLKPEPTRMQDLRSMIVAYHLARKQGRPVKSDIYDRAVRNLESVRTDYESQVKLYAEVFRGYASEDIDEALESGILLVQRRNVPEVIRIDSLDTHPITRFLYRDFTEPIKDFLLKRKRRSIEHITQSVRLMNRAHIRLPFCRPLWINSPNNGLFISTNVSLAEKNTVFGVSRVETNDLEELVDSDVIDSDLEELELPPDY